MATRPKFNDAWAKFLEVHQHPDGRRRTAKEIGDYLGGKVKVNFDAEYFTNACAIRLSYVLNYTGNPIKSGNDRSSGSPMFGIKKPWYFFRVKPMRRHLVEIFGNAEVDARDDFAMKLADRKGIICFEGTGFNDATGHLTLWNGATCCDKCYFGPLDHPSFVPTRIRLWSLK